MNILRRYQEYKRQKEYERSVRFRMNHTPYGDMYGQVMAYRRAQGRHVVKEEAQRLEQARHMKERARAVFMFHLAATAQDFERCWPSIRDQLFVRYTLSGLEVMLNASNS